MNRIIIIFLLVFGLGSSLVYLQFFKQGAAIEAMNYNEKIVEPFGLKLQLDKIEQDQYNLSFTIELAKESYVISPFSKDSIYGNVSIAIEESNDLKIDQSLLEIPNSIEEFDPIIELPVKFVRQNTTYIKKLKVIGKDDFEISGLVEFVLEPICIPYDIEFTIASRSGELSVKKTKTLISKEYKR